MDRELEELDDLLDLLNTSASRAQRSSGPAPGGVVRRSDSDFAAVTIDDLLAISGELDKLIGYTALAPANRRASSSGSLASTSSLPGGDLSRTTTIFLPSTTAPSQPIPAVTTPAQPVPVVTAAPAKKKQSMSLSDLPCFVENLTRERTEQLLSYQPAGTFVLRQSADNSFVISARADADHRGYRHIKVDVVDGTFRILLTDAFPNIIALVQAYAEPGNRERSKAILGPADEATSLAPLGSAASFL